MTFVEKSGKTVDAAIENALDELGVGRSSVDVEILETPSKGFLGIGAREARVKVTLVRSALEEVEAAYAETQKAKAQQKKPVIPEKQPVKSQTQSVQPKAFATVQPDRVKSDRPAVARPDKKPAAEQVDNGVDAAEEAKIFLNGLFEKIGIKDVLIERLTGEDGYVRLNVHGNNLGVLIGKHGYNLEAIQYLVNLIGNRDAGIKKRIIVDIEGYRIRRAETLTRLAIGMANKVKRSGKAMAFEPMSPHERKVIHSALQRDRFVTTHSEGDEPNRKIVVTPKNSRPFNNRPFNRNNNSVDRKPVNKSAE